MWTDFFNNRVYKYLVCIFQYLFWGKSWLAPVLKIVGWVFLAVFSLQQTDELKLVKGSKEVMQLPASYWPLIVVGGGLLIAACGAAWVRVKGLIFKVDEELELDRTHGYFRLAIYRRGWVTSIEAPSVRVQNVIDAKGEKAMPEVPLELGWMNHPPPERAPHL